ncbi:hypothetical protein [Ramlibacter humi]|uniref:hypothetical protein n=1 Tax=Ramlibacter humi TaxID=2530451 RepID=UPI00142FBD85|nr:hypothetical protein [Ramlibacter humi]
MQEFVRTRWPDLRLSAVRDEASIAISSFRIALDNGIAIEVANDFDMHPYFSMMRVAGGPAGLLPFEQACEEAESLVSGGSGFTATDGLTVTGVLRQIRLYSQWAAEPRTLVESAG